MAKRKTSAERIEECRDLASRTASAALTAAPEYQMVVLDAAETLGNFAYGMALKAKAEAKKAAIIQLPAEATLDELSTVRCRQSARRGTDVYLPSWSSIAQALPNAFLRSALFATGRSVQRTNEMVMAGDKSLRVSEEIIATFKNLTLVYSGYPLCQFDRQVYATCLDYYRDKPLAPAMCASHIRTTFYGFCQRLGINYNPNIHKAVRASLLRLNYAQLRMRINRMNLDVPRLLSVSFEDGAPTGDMKGSDLLFLQVSEAVAELFGPAAWTALETEAVGYEGLKGWLANFYASHSCVHWIPIKKLYEMSKYESRMNNFKIGLVQALNKLKDESTPLKCRVAEYHFSEDGRNLLVRRTEWPKRTAD